VSMPIQRQSESYGVFDGGDLRFAKEYTTRDLPEGLINALSGPRITAGMNNRRQAGPDLPSYNMVSGRPGDDRHSEAEEAYYRQQEQGPMVPPDEHHVHAPGFSESPQLPGGGDPGFGVGGYDDYDPHSVENLPPDYGEQFAPHLSSFTAARHREADGPAPDLMTPSLFRPGPGDAQSTLLGGEKAFVNDRPVAKDTDWVTAAAAQPQVVPGWVGHGYAAGHRVGLPWRETVIPGTVTHLDGQTVGIRWDDGQHSTEEPKDLRPL